MISQVSIQNFGPFTHLNWDTQNHINLLIGTNDTGKTYLLKALYCIVKSLEEYTKRQQSDREPWKEILADKLYWTFQVGPNGLGEIVNKSEGRLRVSAELLEKSYYFAFGKDTTRRILDCSDVKEPVTALNTLFLPPKEVLTALEAIAATREQLHIFGFDDTYQDLITALRLPPQKSNLPQRLNKVLQSLEKVFEGEVVKEGKEFLFRRGRERYSMSQTAEGIKKIGILTTLIKNGNLNKNTILFIDEPETNLHPLAVFELVTMLFELSSIGVQVIIATHSYFVVKQFEMLSRKYNKPVQLSSLIRDGRAISLKSASLQWGMPDNLLVEASIKQYEEEVLLDLGA
ncbi:AAA family ATPase [Oscillatoria sp. CS-180]|uniref:AAA family ATPase n=1 Tax=Oscillatoria sp. CS-180 TaxID=3021720 RepID=UPI00232D5D9F|nr:AAA family ATPase [Oscillatoria sp. CS-180]MDB9528949.1 AAA family ATPase [Oscillatoria sp. CS-180]